MGAAMRGWAIILAVVLSTGCTKILGLHHSEDHPFEHRAHVLKGVACTTCHQEMMEAPDDGPLHLPETDVCLQCHEKPHDERRCRSCHGLDFTPTRISTAKRHLRFAHAIHLPEVAGNCARCHQDVSMNEHTLLPRMASCLSCHEHADSFEIAECDNCHHDLEAELSRPVSHLVHEEDYVRRHRTDAAANRALCETCHTQSQCAGCHGVNVPLLPQRRDFANPTLSGLHRAGFRSRHAREAAADRGLCITCHSESTCQRCHAEQGLAADGTARFNPHPPGWVSVTRGGNAHGPAARRDPVSCAGCHGGSGEQTCVRCHRVGGVGGSVHPPGWESNLNRRTDRPCRLCHE